MEVHTLIKELKKNKDLSLHVGKCRIILKPVLSENMKEGKIRVESNSIRITGFTDAGYVSLYFNKNGRFNFVIDNYN